MTYRWETANWLDRVQDDFDRLWTLSRWPDVSGLFDQSAWPTIDVVESENNVTIWADVPGLSREQLDLSMAGNMLTIKGEKPEEPRTKGVFRDETWSGKFQRTLSLSDTVDPDKVSAEVKDGVLKIVVGKKPEHQPRQITVVEGGQ